MKTVSHGNQMPFIFRVSVGKDFRCFTLLVQTSTAKLSVEIVPFKPLVKALQIELSQKTAWRTYFFATIFWKQ